MTNANDIKEMSKKINLSGKKLKRILDEVSKPSLVDTHCSFDDKIGIPPSDAVN